MTSPGRPSLFTPELAARICERLAAGQTLRSICQTTVDMPSEATVRAWALDDVQGFSAQYRRAREIGYHGMFDELKEIADTTEEGVIETVRQTAEGRTVETKTVDMIEHRKLKVATRQWMLGRALPKIYGDKLQVDANVTHDISNLTDEELGQELLNRGAAPGSAEAAGTP